MTKGEQLVISSGNMKLFKLKLETEYDRIDCYKLSVSGKQSYVEQTNHMKCELKTVTLSQGSHFCYFHKNKNGTPKAINTLM